MNLGKIIIVMGIVLFAVSCKNDPYPEKVKFESLQQSKQRTQKVLQKKTMFILAQPFMQFVEGEEGRYKIDGIVPSGSPTIDFVGLPEGASFDFDTRELVWTPDFSVVSRKKDVNTAYREYSVRIQMNDEMNKLIFVEKKIVLVVFDSTRETLIWTDRRGDLTEEKLYTQDIEILSEDFPGMDFEVFSPDAPKGTSLKKKEAGKYELRFRPASDFTRVFDSKNSEGYYRDINFRIHAVDPQGKRATKVVHWRVWDKNKVVRVSAPSRLQGTDRLVFAVALIDLNGEYRPELKIESGSNPDYGDFYIRHSSPFLSKHLFFAQYEIVWENIPRSKIGTEEVLDFKACGHLNRIDSCQTFSVAVEFKIKKQTPPRFNRSAWPLGVIKQYTVGKAPLNVFFPILDNKKRSSQDRVEIEVSDPSLQVEWKFSRLRVTGSVAGLYQFNVKAINSEGLESVESMMVEIVVPEVDNGEDGEEV